MKRYIKKIGLLLCTIPLISSLTLPLTSCNGSSAGEITFCEDKIKSTSRDFSFKFQSDIKPKTSVHVDFCNGDYEHLAIIYPNMVINEGINSIHLTVTDDSITNNVAFVFSLTLSFPNDSSMSSINSNKLTLYYTPEKKAEDIIQAIKPQQINTNSYTFNYSFKFQNPPQNLNDIKVRLNRDYFSYLSLEPWNSKQDNPVYDKTYSCEFREFWYFVDITVYMKVAVFTQTNLSFGATFSFVNSFGNAQETTISDLCATLFTPKGGDIPLDYLELVWQRDKIDVLYVNRLHLRGFKKNVTPDLINSFNNLRIPDDVHVIDDLSFFDGKKTFTVEKIIFGKAIEYVSENAFFYCNCEKLLCLDMSRVWDEEHLTPTFAFQLDKNTNSTKPFNNGLLNHHFVSIIPSAPADPVAWRNLYFNFLSLMKDDYKWFEYEANQVVPDSFYNAYYDESYDGCLLDGIDFAPECDASKYGIIMLPEKLDIVSSDGQKIESNVVGISKHKIFNSFREKPFLVDGVESSRQLFFSSNTITLPSYPLASFSYDDEPGLCGFMGLSGYINIPTNLKVIPIGCFACCNSYNPTAYPSYEQQKIQFCLENAVNLNTIGEYAFSYITNITGIIKISNTIKKMDSNIFFASDSKNPEWEQESKDIRISFDLSEYEAIPSWKTTSGSDSTDVFFNSGKYALVILKTLDNKNEWINWFYNRQSSLYVENWTFIVQK